MNWFDRLRTAVVHPAASEVREALLAAMKDRSRVEVVSLGPQRGASSPRHDAASMLTTVELVRDEDFIVSRPVSGGTTRQIARYEQLQVTFALRAGRLSGTTENLGRVKIPSGAGGELYGYRLAFPTALHVCDRRSELRLVLGEDMLREARIGVLTRVGPIMGLIEDISASGARIRCRNAGDHLVHDRPAHFEAELAEPIGTVEQFVRILGVEIDEQTGERIVRVLFEEKVPVIEEILRRSRRRCA